MPTCGVAFAERDEEPLQPHGSIDLDEEKPRRPLNLGHLVDLGKSMFPILGGISPILRGTLRNGAGSSLLNTCGVAFAERDEDHLRPHGLIDLVEEKRSVVSDP